MWHRLETLTPRKRRGACYEYDYQGQEWLTLCGSGSCSWHVYTPNLREAKRLRLKHTRTECGNGY